MKIPLHIRLRKKLKFALHKFLSLFISYTNVETSINKNEIKNIILIRSNYRIGNLVFLTPLINELYKHLPEAKIDLIVGMKLAGDILQPLPNVHKVIDIPRKLLLHPYELYKFIKTTRGKKYDLAINISNGSTSSQIVSTLINSVYKANYHSSKNWAPATHTIKPYPLYKHASFGPLEFLQLFHIELPTNNIYLDIKLTQKELIVARAQLEELLEKNHKNIDNNKTIALFRNARFDKKITDEWWNRWFDKLIELDNTIVVIDILSPDILRKLNDNVLEYANKNLRHLGAFFHNCDMYVSADTGPMHLASASGAKTFALFNKTSIENYGTIGPKDKTIDINHISPEQVAKKTLEHLNR